MAKRAVKVMAAAAAVLSAFATSAAASAAPPTAGAADPGLTSASGGQPWPTQCSATYFNGDARLGPVLLPHFGQVGTELIGYNRTGGLPVSKFLRTYYDPAANHGKGAWIYPPDNGYVIRPDGTPEEFSLRLNRGEYIDRYGSEHGAFLSPAGMSYAARSIPPQNLDGAPPNTCDYYDYRVARPFTVEAGPIAAWFAQPGCGMQYELRAGLVPGAPSPLSVAWLVSKGYLTRVSTR